MDSQRSDCSVQCTDRMYINAIQTVPEHSENKNTLGDGSFALPSPLLNFLNIELNC